MRAAIRIARPALLLSALLSCGGEERPSRVLLLGIDGLDPRTIDLLMSEGKLPNFARLRTDGAYGRLISQEPLLSPIVWTTIATGKAPDQHGIGHFVAVDPESGEEMPVSSAMRKAAALWNIASAAEKRVATVGWWATWPPEEVNGVVVSDHTGELQRAVELYREALRYRPEYALERALELEPDNALFRENLERIRE